jgi:DNA-binding response OmpR family regulator
MGRDVRVLVVEDEEDLRVALVNAFETEGYEVASAADIAGAGDRIAESRFDCVVLDRKLPDGDAIEYVRERKGAGWDAPVLFLTGLDSIAERVEGFTSGGDDYLVKPFAMAVLLARVKALCTRPGAGRPAVLRFADVELDSARRQTRRGGVLLTLSALEFAVLEYLMSRPEQVVSRSDIIEHCWGEQNDPTAKVVDKVIERLRRKLREPSPLQTVHGVGYGLFAGAVG